VGWQHQIFLRPGLVRRLKRAMHRAGFEVTALGRDSADPHYFEIYERVEPFTMTSLSRVFACIAAAEHVCAQSIEGAIVECGVWRGGSTMAALLALVRLEDFSREVWLYDTYDGMAAPTQNDADLDHQLFAAGVRDDGGSDWCRAELGEVFTNVESCGYPMDHVKFLKGKVEDTLPRNVPERISLLRLDTDFYESTRQELEYLYPRLSSGGMLIIDDYGAFAGARRAVDEYLAANSIRAFLHRIDSTGRLLIKP
jgi:O-methyltransferase